MKRYDSYKDSSVEWIGDIPSHWDITKLKFIGNIICGGTPSTSNEEYWTGDIPWIQSGKVQNNIVLPNVVDKKITTNALVESSTKLVKEDSILVAITGATCSNIGYLTFETAVNQSIVAVEPINFNSVLLFNVLKSQKEQILYHQSGGAQGGVTKGDVMNIYIPLPTVQEQTAIANYLDQKTTQIDDLIVKKERLIQLLEEERTAIINQAVTKGLDPSVPMKDSGIEWLGEIPEHWEEARIKNVVKIIGRIGFRGYTTEDLVEKGEGAISLSPSNIKNHILNIEDCTYLSWEKYHESPEIKIFENDIILVKTGSTIGKTAIIPHSTPEMTLNPQLVVFKDIRLNPMFMYYMMISNYFQGYFSVYTAGGSTPAISQEKINNFQITFPSSEEQTQISNFIGEKEFGLKEVISKTRQEIELLKEYKTALISEVVTGKVDVRNEKLN
jgi:type I restriction enzyme S subunit